MSAKFRLLTIDSYVLIAGKIILRGHLYRLEYICVWIAPQITATWASISPLCVLRTSIVCLTRGVDEGSQTNLNGRMVLGSAAGDESGWE